MTLPPAAREAIAAHVEHLELEIAEVVEAQRQALAGDTLGLNVPWPLVDVEQLRRRREALAELLAVDGAAAGSAA